MAANGEKIPNRGEMRLNLIDSGNSIKSTFQVAKVARPLYSVAKITGAGYEVVFEKERAVVREPGTTKPVAQFQRRNGLYVGAMMLKIKREEADRHLPDFHRQASAH